MSKEVAPLLAGALSAASVRYLEEHRKWNSLSFRLGGLLPNSVLSWSIQNMGTLDLLVRCLEDEAPSFVVSTSDAHILTGNFQSILSDAWIGGVYEFLRLLRSRKLVADEDFLKLAHDFEMVRIIVEKHEVPKDDKLKAPLQFGKYSTKGEETDNYLYDRTDPARSHIAPRGLSESGSTTWHVVDHLAKKQYWLERRSLSDRLLALEIGQITQVQP